MIWGGKMPNKFWKGRQQKIINNNKVQLPNNCDFKQTNKSKKNSSNQEGILITTMQYQLVRISSGWSFFSTNCHFQKHKHMRNNMTLPIIPVSFELWPFCLGWSKIFHIFLKQKSFRNSEPSVIYLCDRLVVTQGPI